jgi:hypothetical protein
MLITDKGCRPNNCNSCKFHYSAVNYNYGLTDVEHKDMDGFICAAFAHEGIMVHMSGLVNDSVDFCEEYVPRGEK